MKLSIVSTKEYCIKGQNLSVKVYETAHGIYIGTVLFNSNGLPYISHETASKVNVWEALEALAAYLQPSIPEVKIADFVEVQRLI